MQKNSKSLSCPVALIQSDVVELWDRQSILRKSDAVDLSLICDTPIVVKKFQDFRIKATGPIPTGSQHFRFKNSYFSINTFSKKWKIKPDKVTLIKFNHCFLLLHFQMVGSLVSISASAFKERHPAVEWSLRSTRRTSKPVQLHL